MGKRLLIILFLLVLLINLNGIMSQTNESIKIKDVLPHTPPILISTEFSVLLDKAYGNLTYLWNFGDGSPEIITKTGVLSHTYQRKGAYELKVEVYNLTEKTNKTVRINAISPKEYISSIINMYKEDLKTVEDQINSLPQWISDEVKKNISLGDLNSSIFVQEKRYENATSDDEYTDIVKKLLDIRIPFGFLVSEEISPSECFPNENQLDLEVLKEIGAGNVSGEREDYFNAIELWGIENVYVSLESKTYSYYYRDKVVNTLFSHVKINFEPLKKIDKMYFLINGNPEKIILKNGTESKQNFGTAAGIIFSNLDRDKSIEIIYPETIDIIDCPFYFSPDFNELDKSEDIVITCDNDGVCDNGENSLNCRNDCKPLKMTFMLIFILFLSALVIYIILQEWYKRRYETRLFPNKNDLYNIMSFINNSLKQGLKKQEVIGKLKEMDWGGEQLNYAWKKFHGKRTGMFEIPVFAWIEKRKIQKELEIRNNSSINRQNRY
ncbi:MAG: PKD domain-containing protein [Candidatus Nanoarchaeia archaeon]|nr:PKD domain-containing protein [Candidatus Nanoarchaeia archaeon]